jgi:hypothetical protein
VVVAAALMRQIRREQAVLAAVAQALMMPLELLEQPTRAAAVVALPLLRRQAAVQAAQAAPVLLF